nr:MAG TPA: hypothetical protein [Caudoviricetes sp.]
MIVHNCAYFISMLVCGNVGNVYTTGRYTRGCAHKTPF